MNIIKSLTYQEKRSTFLALLLKLDSQKEAEDVLKELQLEHKDARHILRALRVKNQYGVYITEASDDLHEESERPDGTERYPRCWRLSDSILRRDETRCQPS